MGIYYIGSRQSDISCTFDANTADDFFTGSITCYGDNKNGNVAYNVISGIQLCDDDSKYGARNNAIYTKFISEQCQKIIVSDPDAKFLPYSLYYAKKVPARLRSRIICCNDAKTLNFLNSKFNFKKLIDGKILQAPFEFKTGKEVIENLTDGFWPNQKQVVIQTQYSAGGEGTYIVTQELCRPEEINELIKKINRKEQYIISDYIENIGSGSFQIQLSANETAVYPAGMQLMNGPKWFGNDLAAFSEMPESVKAEVSSMAQKFGSTLRELNPDLRGHFGVDFIIAKTGRSRVYAVETNPRFTGVTGLMNILCHKAGIGSVYQHSFRAFYDEKTSFSADFKKIVPNARRRNAVIRRNKNGQIVSAENDNCNHEGLDETAYQEEGIYTHAVFEEIKKFNVFDDRTKYKTFVSKKAVSGKTKKG